VLVSPEPRTEVARGCSDASPDLPLDPSRVTLGWRTLLTLGVAAFVIRLGYVLLAMRHYAPVSDAAHYNEIASNVAHGHGVSSTYPYLWRHPTAFRPPAYPLLLGAAYAVFGVHVGVAQALNMVLGSLVVVSIGVLAGRLGGPRAGVVAAGLAAIFPPLISNDVAILTEPLALLLLCLGLIACQDRRWLIAGVASGLLVLTRPSAQLFVPIIAVYILCTIDWRRAVVYVAAAAVVIAPWVIRNEIDFHHPDLVTSNGFNVAAIWSAEALAQNHFIDPVKDPRMASVRDYVAPGGGPNYRMFNEANLDAAFRKAGIDGLKENPGDIPKMLIQNVGYLTDFSWHANANAERIDGRNLAVRHATLPFVWLVELAGLAGLVLLVRRRQWLVPIAAAYFFVVALATVSPPRLRAPVDALFCVAVGVLVTSAIGWWRRRNDVEPVAPTGVLGSPRVRALQP
jgi:4-amino-4-deoxy-L-arabinose transferase-like glycosyltransferase